jgi:DNA phosphorothioation system restriction enzyme
MSLRNLTPSPKISYRSGRDDVVRTFYIPCLKQSVVYRRAVGYFTSAGLAHAAQGVANLVARHGKMQLIASPYLQESDLDALQQAADHPQEVLKQIISRSLIEIEDFIARDRLNALAWLIADGSLEVRLALRLDDNGKIGRGLYHEKIGIFTDSESNHVAFSGSLNETVGGLVDNFESIDAYWSWDDPQGRVAEKIHNFDEMWQDHTSGVRVLEFTEISKELLRKYKREIPPAVNEHSGEYWLPPRDVKPGTIPRDLELRGYQKAAIREWVTRGGRGILAMATGAGKTLTALYLACKVAEKEANRPLVILVVCPYLNLAKQWGREMARFGIPAIPCFQSRATWSPLLQEGYQKLAAKLTDVIGVVVTNATFLSPAFQAALQPNLGHHLLIADEVHNLGGAKLKTSLPDFIQLRLGLSATPERHYDEEGTKAIFDYFGDIAYEFTIADAIKADPPVLCPYHYHPVLVDLTDDEADQYFDLSKSIEKLFHYADDEYDNDVLKALLLKRARLLASAANKLPMLDSTLRSLKTPVEKALFYTGDGRVDDPLTDEEQRQITAVARLLGETHGLRVRKFTFEEGMEDREEILTGLRSGRLNGVVAIRCLDEGIDLPDVRMGFILASSTNPRQFIQRRGRLLRRAPGKDYAVIYDFIVQPPDFGGDDTAFNLERRLFRRELTRVLEFCQTAENGPAALATLQHLRIRYNLLGDATQSGG